MKCYAYYLLLLISLGPAFGRQRIDRWCEKGNQTVSIPGIASASTTKVQQSFPVCTVTVYVSGSVTLASIYSDNAGTSLANPFSADVNGHYFFYVSDGTYDIQMSGGGLSSPLTYGAVPAFDPLAPGLTINACSTSPGVTDPYAILNTAVGLVPSGGVIDARCLSGTVLMTQTLVLGQKSNITFLFGKVTIQCPGGATPHSCFTLWSGTNAASSNMSFIGAGPGNTVFTIPSGSVCNATNHCNVFELHNPSDSGNNYPDSSHILIRDMTLDGNKPGVANPGGAVNDPSHNGIHSNGTSYDTFDNLEVINWWYCGVCLGVWNDHTAVSNLHTKNVGNVSPLGYAGIQVQGNSRFVSVVNHIGTGDYNCALLGGNISHSYYQGVCDTPLASGLIDQEGGGSFGEGNEIHADIYKSPTYCAQMGGDSTSTQLSSRFYISCNENSGDDGFYILQNTNGEEFHLVSYKSRRAGLTMLGSGAIVDLTVINPSQIGVGTAAALNLNSPASNNLIRLIAVDTNMTPNMTSAFAIASGANNNHILAEISPTSTTWTDSGTGNTYELKSGANWTLYNGSLPSAANLSTTTARLHCQTAAQFCSIIGGPGTLSGQILLGDATFAGGLNVVSNNGGVSALIHDDASAQFRVVKTSDGVNTTQLISVDNAGNLKFVPSGDPGFAHTPRGSFPAFFPGNLTSTWTAAAFNPDIPIVITRIIFEAKTAPVGCGVNAVIRVTAGASNTDTTISGGFIDTGAIAVSVSNGVQITLSVQTAASGCGTAPADVNAIVEYRVQ